MRLAEQQAALNLLAESERRYRQVFEASPISVAMADEHGRFARVNDALCRMVGRPAEELIGRSGAEFVHPDDLALHANVERDQQESPDGVVRVEARHLHADGSYRWIEMTVAAVPGPHGEHWTLFYGQDVSERKAAELALRESEAQLAAIASISRTVQLGRDPRPQVLESVRTLSGASTVVLVEAATDGRPAVTGGTAASVDTAPRPTGRSLTAQAWDTGVARFRSDVRAGGAGVDATDPVDVAGRSALWQPVVGADAVLAVLVVTWRSAVRESDRAVGAIRAIAHEAGVSLQAVRLRAELEASANTDPMTGSLNRRAWDAALRNLVDAARCTGRPLAVALVDLDHFKSYNDEFGHSAGDVLLREFADAARSCLRVGDVFARWGGEEFVLALPDCGPGQVGPILARVRAAVPGGRTCSIGVTTWIVDEPVTGCVARADSALYDAKRGGRDRVSVR